MGSHGNVSNEIAELMHRLDEVLAKGHFDRDFRRTALIGLEFCDLLASSLNDQQRNTIEVARQHLSGHKSDSYEKCLNEMTKIIDLNQRLKSEKSDFAVNRIIWTALNENTGLSDYTGDFLVGLGVDAGLNAKQMSDVFARHVPGFDPT